MRACGRNPLEQEFQCHPDRIREQTSGIRINTYHRRHIRQQVPESQFQCSRNLARDIIEELQPLSVRSMVAAICHLYNIRYLSADHTAHTEIPRHYPIVADTGSDSVLPHLSIGVKSGSPTTFPL